MPQPPCHVQALLRHVGHPHPALRAQLLLIVGKLRLRRLQNVIQSRPSSHADAEAAATNDGSFGGGAPPHGSSLPVGELPKTQLFRGRLKSAAAAALTAALRVSFSRGGHDWGILSGACMSLVVLYFTTAASSSKGDRSLAEDPVEGAVESSELEVRFHTLEDGRAVSNVFVYSPRPSKAYVPVEGSWLLFA